MPRSLWFKVFVVLAALWAPFSQADTGWQPIQETIRKSEKDTRQYQAIRLDNDMVVLLVSDPQAVKSLSALVVPVGSLQDPADHQGLAHFLEHMTLMGSQKYPQPDSLAEFLKLHGGSHNASTAPYRTAFYLEVENDALDGAVDRLADAIAAPLLDKKYINARIEPGAVIRDQVEIGDNAVIMMGAIINIGAIIGEGTMIDMGAVLGGRATVGKNCHIGAGTVLAGVIEPASAVPVVIEDDVVIGVSFPRYSSRTVQAMSFARDRKATTVAITDSEASPLAPICKYTLKARSDMASFGDSLVAPLSLVNALLVAVSRAKNDDLANTFQTLERIWEDYGVYEKVQE